MTAASKAPSSAGSADASPSTTSIGTGASCARSAATARAVGSGSTASTPVTAGRVVLESAPVAAPELEHATAQPGEEAAAQLPGDEIRAARLAPLQVAREARLVRAVERRVGRHRLDGVPSRIARIVWLDSSSGDSEMTVAGRSNRASASASGSARSVPSP